MSEMQRHPSGLPLTAGARIIRGFRRIGLVLAIPVLLIGIGTSLYVGTETYTTHDRRVAQANCLIKKSDRDGGLPALSYDPAKIDLQKTGCSGPIYSAYFWEVSGIAAVPASFETDFGPAGIGGSLASVAGALLIYLACWAVGWIFAGFTRD